jgi:hypothetical protein
VTRTTRIVLMQLMDEQDRATCVARIRRGACVTRMTREVSAQPRLGPEAARARPGYAVFWASVGVRSATRTAAGLWSR